jgi:hypothetical protein
VGIKKILPLILFLALTLQAHATLGQYIPRQGGQAGLQAIPMQGPEPGTAGLGLAFVTYLDGESLLMSTDDTDWSALSPNLSLRIGDRVWVQDGARAEIRFPLGATAWVNYQSELDVARMESGSRADTVQLALVSGEAAFDVKGFARPGSVFQVDIPGASIRAFRAARFRVNTLADGTEQIGVIGGSIVLETPDGLTDVTAGHLAEIQPDRRVVMDFLPAPDEWDDWVRSRAQIYDRPAASVRYLPADLSSYAHEFDTSGRWVSDPVYGSVWVPVVDRGWSPYSNGRWVWQANDYVWLGYDPWYAPFHYGRWNWQISLGWFWVAPRGRAYWSPGYVAWSIGGDEVSWVPLGRNEIYYGYGNYGPSSVNVYNTKIVNVTNVYVNSRVNNGVLVVKRDNFLRGKIAHERIVPSGNPFEHGGSGGLKVIGRPPVKEIQPIRETRQPRPDVVIRRVSLPPVRVENESKTMKKRVVAPTKTKSAFTPGKAPAQLKNVVKEKELEQWVAPKPPRPETVVVPAPGGPQGKIETRKKTLTKATEVQQVQPPPGKHQFKRVKEPQGGATGEIVPAGVPVERTKDGQNEKDEKGKGKK